MSGHSKWATIHRQKEITDAKKGQAWTKITNAIIVAVRSSGGIIDPEKNFKLRLVIEKGRALNMPKENIERAIARGAGGEEGTSLEEVIYEGFAPGGVAVIVEAATDNKNRTVQEIKNIFERGGGTLGGPGAVSFLFTSKGFISVSRSANPEEQILEIMDLGVEDIEEGGESIDIYTAPELLEETKRKLQEKGYEIKNFELTMKPNTLTSVNDPNTAHRVLDLLDKIEDLSDVQRVFANIDIPDDVTAAN